VFVFAYRDQGLWGDERGDLADCECAGGGVRVDGVGVEEQVGGVSVEFGPLGGVQGVFDGQFVQPELLVDHVEVGLGRAAKVEPDHRAFGREVVGDVRDREVGLLEDSVPVEPGTHGRTRPCGVHRRLAVLPAGR
jgi:hypothetical protein